MEAKPIAAWEDIAESAYKAYSAVTDNKNFRGEEMPKFSDLPEKIKTAWQAAVRQVDSISTGIEFLSDGTVKFPDEQRWRKWEKP